LDAFHYNRLLGRGVNLGNALEAPKEGDWGFRLKEEYFPLIKKAGFQSVRIPVRWSAHAQPKAPYTIDADFFRRVDWAIEQALGQGLVAVLNIHHYDEMYAAPAGHKARFVALWKQIAERYRGRPDRLYFELLNEPHNKLTDEVWNGYLREALAVVRESNPKRAVIVGPGSWNNLSHLKDLKLPADDRLLIATFHYYSPFHFTHQGASWVKGSDKWLGMRWQGTPAERQAVIKDLETAVAWGKKENRPLFLGEFGAFSKADMDSRARWTAFIREQAEKRGVSWAYWEFGSGFGVCDPEAKRWRQPLLSALVPK
jgi:endoglucanase